MSVVKTDRDDSTDSGLEVKVDIMFKGFQDHETRIRFLEKWVASVGGTAGIVTVLYEVLKEVLK